MDAPLFETRRLKVRRMTRADAAFMLETLNDPGFIQFIGDRGVRTLEEAEAYIEERVLGSYAKHGFGMYRVSRRDDDLDVGTVGFVRRDGLDGPDIGFAFLAAHVGQGYGYEAARALIDWGRETLALPPLLAITAEDNLASGALLAKLGFRPQGVIELPGHTAPSRLFVEA